MLRVTNLSFVNRAYAQKSLRFGSTQELDISTLEGKLAIMNRARELEQVSQLSEAEKLCRSIFERPIEEFRTNHKDKYLLNNVGRDLSGTLFKQGYADKKVIDKNKLVESAVTLQELGRKLFDISLTNNDTFGYKLAEQASKDADHIADIYIHPNNLSDEYNKMLVERGFDGGQSS